MVSDSSKAVDYVSSLIDPNAIQDVIYMSSVDDTLKSNNTSVLISDDNEQQYVILEDDDMELKDIIAQYEQSEDDNPTKSKPAK